MAVVETAVSATVGAGFAVRMAVRAAAASAVRDGVAVVVAGGTGACAAMAVEGQDDHHENSGREPAHCH